MSTANLTLAQNHYAMLELSQPNTSISNLSNLLYIENTYSYDAINNALNKLVENFDAYRIHIINESGELKQSLQPFNFEYFPLVEFTDEAQYNAWIDQQKSKCLFDLNSDLYDFTIVKKPDGKHCVFFTHHHIITDAWSITHSVNYVAKTLIGHNMEPNPYSYLDITNDDKKYLNSNRYEIDKNYWFNKVLNFEITDFLPKLQNENYKSLRKSYSLTEDEFKFLHKMCSDYSISISTMFMSLTHLYVSKLSNKKQNSIGLMVHNRSSNIEKETCGLFTKALPLIVEINPEQTVESFINLVKKENFTLLKHRKIPTTLLIEQNKEKDVTALADFAISYHNMQYDNEITKEGFKEEWLLNEANLYNKLNMNISNRNNENTLHIDYDFSTFYLSETYIEQMHYSLMDILVQFHNNPHTCLNDIDVVPFK